MSRGLTSGMVSAVTGLDVIPVFLVEIVFSAHTVRLTSWRDDLVWNTYTWLANGYFRLPADVTENSELASSTAEIELRGADAALMSLVLGEINQGNKVTIYFACLDSSHAIIADPYLLYRAFLDNASLDDSDVDSVVRLTLESELAALDRVNEWRWNNESQQALFSGDIGFQYSDRLEDWNGFWGKSKPPKNTRPKRSDTKPRRRRK